MGKCSRNRAERQQNRNEKQGHGFQAAPRTNPPSPGTAHLIDLKNFKLSDLLGGTPPPRRRRARDGRPRRGV